MQLRELLAAHNSYRDPALEKAVFTPDEVWEALPADKKKVGASAENRPLYQLERGTGPTTVLLWTQMHGNEPTATLAVLDVLRFLAAKDTDFDAVRSLILDRLRLRFLPVINPDGVWRNQRRTAWHIDPNRDFRAVTSPEAAFLRQQGENFRPDWGFNLHDQNRYHSVGKTEVPPTLTFLAPPPAPTPPESERYHNYEDAQRLLAHLITALEPLLGGKMSRYDDTFEPRAFGDNFQRIGIRTLLFEGGFIPNDPERQRLRGYYFTALVGALYAIATMTFRHTDTSAYHQLPPNESYFFDLILQDLEIATPATSFRTDVGLKQLYKDVWEITDIGDLSDYHGHESWIRHQLNTTAYPLVPEQRGKVWREGHTVFFEPLG